MITRKSKDGYAALSAGVESLARIKKVLDVPLTQTHRDLLLNDADPMMRETMIRLGQLTPEQQEKALTDESWTVRQTAVDQGRLTPLQLHRAVEDKYKPVRDSARAQGATAGLSCWFMDLGYWLNCLIRR